MRTDPIVEAVRKVRERHARQFGFNLRAIAADLRKKEQQHRERLVSYPAKPARRAKTARVAEAPGAYRTGRVSARRREV